MELPFLSKKVFRFVERLHFRFFFICDSSTNWPTFFGKSATAPQTGRLFCPQGPFYVWDPIRLSHTFYVNPNVPANPTPQKPQMGPPRATNDTRRKRRCQYLSWFIAFRATVCHGSRRPPMEMVVAVSYTHLTLPTKRIV